MTTQKPNTILYVRQSPDSPAEWLPADLPSFWAGFRVGTLMTVVVVSTLGLLLLLVCDSVV